MEDNEQLQPIFGRLSKRFSLLDQQMRSLHGLSGFHRRIPFEVKQGGDKRDLQLDLLATHSGSGRQGRDQFQAARQLLYGFSQGRTIQRPLSSLVQQTHSLLNLPSFSAVTRQQFGLVFGNLRELAFQSFRNASVECASRFAQ